MQLTELAREYGGKPAVIMAGSGAVYVTQAFQASSMSIFKAFPLCTAAAATGSGQRCAYQGLRCRPESK